MKNNRLLYILLAVLAVMLIGFVVAKKQGWVGGPAGMEVISAKAKPANIVEKVSASGKVQPETEVKISPDVSGEITELYVHCLLYTSPSPRDRQKSRMPSSA